MVLHCHGRTYGNAYLIAYNVGPLPPLSLSPPSILPLLETPAEGFSRNLPEFGRCIPFDALHGSEICPADAHFQSRKPPKVTWNEAQRVQWLGNDRNVLFSARKCCKTSEVLLGALS
jgi:hypothetical protein